MLKFEIILLLSWWIIVLGRCVYAFAMALVPNAVATWREIAVSLKMLSARFECKGDFNRLPLKCYTNPHQSAVINGWVF